MDRLAHLPAHAADTIAALASPPGAGARAIVRASGPACAALVRACTSLDARELGARALREIEFDDGVGAQPGWLLWMRGPRSLTGEDVAEFHLPGNPELARAALARLFALGARSAAPGEFTRRAFLAGKLDLSRAEGVLALVSAENDAERRAASRLLAGELARRVDRARDALADVRALCEASLDFDESETGHVPAAELGALLARADEELALARAEGLARPAESGVARVVLGGAPNAGKSQLFNALTGATALAAGTSTGETRTADARAHALVSPLAGTTRDSVSARLALSGAELELWDTAGFAAPASAVERAAQAHARADRGTAELLVWVVDAAAPLPDPAALLAELAPGARVLVAWNKLDLAGARREPPAEWRADPRLSDWLAISGRTGAGVAELKQRLSVLAASRPGVSRELAARHTAALDRAVAALARGRSALAAAAPLELAAEHFRAATDALDDVLGATTPDDVLGRIFARFCIGK